MVRFACSREVPMKVQDLMSSRVAKCSEHDSGERAAELMMVDDCGAIPVVDDEELVVGIVTDRDLCMGAYRRARTLKKMTVASLMSRDVACCNPNDDVRDAEELMRAHHVRRLPVVEATGRLVGIVSLSDFAREAAQEAQIEGAENVRYEDVGKTLGMIVGVGWPARIENVFE